MMSTVIILSVISFIMSMFSFIIGVLALIELRSFMKSTHKVEFLPINGQENIQFKEPSHDEDLEKYDLT